jgi:hypothetical protein
VTLEQRTEQAFVEFIRSLETEATLIHKAMTPSVHSISDGHLTTKTRNALLDGLAELEQACAVFRWAAAHAAMDSRHATPSIESDVRLQIHGRWQNALDFIEGHAIALIEIVEMMRAEDETRDGVLDIRQHAKRLVELGKSLDLPRKPRAKRVR